MNRNSSSELPDRVLHWVKQSVQPGAAVRSIARLYGGTSSIVHSISFQIGENTKSVVLRQFDNAEWLQEEPDAALHEAESLRFASRIDGVPAPELVAYDKTGAACGIPVVLMTQLPGAVVLRPDNMEGWLNGLAQSLARIHSVSADSFPRTYSEYTDIASLEPPEWSNCRELWTTAIGIVQGVRPAWKPCFIHRDYHPANVLWVGDDVTGVVDWVNGCRGPAGIDVGHCRSDLAQLYGVETADAFLDAYMAHAGCSFSYDPYWDILSVFDILFGPPKVFSGWKALGVTELTDKIMEERLDAYMISLMERVSGGKMM